MEVRGVFRSWETFVISSVCILSFFRLFSTAASRPPPILLIYSAITFCFPVSVSVLILYCSSPSLIFFRPSIIRSSPSAFLMAKIITATSTAINASRNTPAPLNTHPMIRNCKNKNAPPTSRTFIFSAVFLEKALAKSASFPLHFPIHFRTFLIRLFFHKVPAFILLTRLRYPIRNHAIV